MANEEPEDLTPVSAAQILRWLAALEEEGVKFYAGLSLASESQWIRLFSKTMVEAETRHRDRFLDYANAADQVNSNTMPPKDSLLPAHLIRILSTQVFVPEADWRIGKRHVSDEEIVKKAIYLEEQVAFLLTQIRPYTPFPEHDFISRVIKEEWGHVEKLERIAVKHFRLGTHP